MKKAVLTLLVSLSLVVFASAEVDTSKYFPVLIQPGAVANYGSLKGLPPEGDAACEIRTVQSNTSHKYVLHCVNYVGDEAWLGL